MATLKQKKTAEIYMENYGTTPIMTKGEILAQVGYTKATQKNPASVFESKGYQQSIKELTFQYGIDKASRLKLLAEIMNDRNKDGTLKDKRAVIEANKETTKMLGEYEQVIKTQELESQQDEIIE